MIDRYISVIIVRNIMAIQPPSLDLSSTDPPKMHSVTRLEMEIPLSLISGSTCSIDVDRYCQAICT